MTIIHVNSNTIKSNRKNGVLLPPLSVRKTRSGKADYAHQIDLSDSDGNVVAKVVYQPETPLSCGAQIWIETNLTVTTHTTPQH
jgi:hypothetical protein